MHTKGQVNFSKRTDGNCELIVSQMEDAVMATIYGDDMATLYGDGECLPVTDNARRIVALWNMADRLNLSTEFIEDGGVDEMVKILNYVIANANRHSKTYPGEILPDHVVIDTCIIGDIVSILSKMGR